VAFFVRARQQRRCAAFISQTAIRHLRGRRKRYRYCRRWHAAASHHALPLGGIGHPLLAAIRDSRLCYRRHDKVLSPLRPILVRELAPKHLPPLLAMLASRGSQLRIR